MVLRITGNGAITTTSTAFVATDLTLTRGAGNYLVWFSASILCKTIDTAQFVGLVARAGAQSLPLLPVVMRTTPAMTTKTPRYWSECSTVPKVKY